MGTFYKSGAVRPLPPDLPPLAYLHKLASFTIALVAVVQYRTRNWDKA